ARGTAFHATRKTEVALDNVLFDGQTPGQNGFLVNEGAQVTARKIHLWNLPLTLDGAALQLNESVIGGDNVKVKIAPTATWKADNNRWGVSSIEFNGTPYTREKLADYVQA